MVEQNIDDLEAHELEIVEMTVAHRVGSFLLLSDGPIDERDKIIESVSQNQVVPIDTEHS